MNFLDTLACALGLGAYVNAPQRGLVGIETPLFPNTNPIFNEVLPPLFLSDHFATVKEHYLRDHNITHVLTISSFVPPPL